MKHFMSGRHLYDFVASHHFNWDFLSVNISRSFISAENELPYELLVSFVAELIRGKGFVGPLPYKV